MNNQRLLPKLTLLFLLTLVPVIVKAFSPNDSLSESANVYDNSCYGDYGSRYA